GGGGGGGKGTHRSRRPPRTRPAPTVPAPARWGGGGGGGEGRGGGGGQPCARKRSATRGLDPRVHPLREKLLAKRMDCRVKPGNDDCDCCSRRPLTRTLASLASTLSPLRGARV